MSRPELLDHVAALSDPTRCRILLLLQRHELTVSELCTVLQLPQSTVSRHLKQLLDQDWLRRRREGTRSLYSLDLAELPPTERRMWLLVSDSLADEPAAQQDRGRLEPVLQARRSRSAEFFASSGEWERVRRELFGHRFDLLAVLGLLDETWTFGDLGCGNGHLSAVLAPYVGRVVAVDSSVAMLDAARQRLAPFANVELRSGELERLPVDDGELDAAALFLVLHHTAAPAKVIAEASRVLRPGGRLLVVDMLPHDRDAYRKELGHVWLGFSESTLRRLLTDGGFESARFTPLPVDAEAKGPNLFLASGRIPTLAGDGDRNRAVDEAEAVASRSRT